MLSLWEERVPDASANSLTELQSSRKTLRFVGSGVYAGPGGPVRNA